MPLFPFSAKRLRRSSRRAASEFNRTLKEAQSAVRQADRTAKAIARTLRPERPRPAPAGRFVTVDGLPVHVIVRGRGRPVVLIHGNGTMAEDFALCGLIDRLAARYRVIALDRPGFGRTARPRHRVWTASAQAALVDRVLEQLKVERPLLVGHSWGTLVALALTAENRRALRGLVLLSGFYFPETRADAALAGPLAVPGFGDAARALVPAAMNRNMAEQAFRRVFWPQPVPTRFSAHFPVDQATSATQLRAGTEDAATMNATASWLQGVYPRMTLPVAIVTGSADVVVNASRHAVRLHAAIPGSTLKLLPGHGHMIHYGARGQIERVIDRMMDPPKGA